MSGPPVFVARVIPDEGLQPLRDACDLDLWGDDLPPPRDELLRHVVGKEALLTLLTDRVDAQLLDAAGPQLKVVSNYAVGFDNLDIPELTRRGIPAGNTPGVLTETTADLAFALMMAAARRVDEGSRYVRAARWKTWGPMLLLGVDLHGATLGIVGFGRIGREMAKRASGFGMRVLYHDVHPATPDEERALNARRVEMDELLASSDLVTLHTNLTDETRHLIDAAALSRMKSTAVLVNTSRGPVVDQAALY
ncbi:MAG: D-glycerate dehydrogenase, partial [Chloroflexota bacterium]|nr:D-glycerate dehydrogenase [Chloroflexota bacterium]